MNDLLDAQRSVIVGTSTSHFYTPKHNAELKRPVIGCDRVQTFCRQSEVLRKTRLKLPHIDTFNHSKYAKLSE